MKKVNFFLSILLLFSVFELTFAQESWTPTSLVNAPLARYEHTAVWTGSRIIIWGGIGNGVYNAGGIFDPISNTWSTTSLSGAPSARCAHTAVWTGSKMIIWGGRDDAQTVFNTGGIYDPGSNSWAATSTNNAPRARLYQTAVWTGSKMIIWGGDTSTNGLYGMGVTKTGGIYDHKNC